MNQFDQFMQNRVWHEVTPSLYLKERVERAQHPTIVMEQRLRNLEVYKRLINDYLLHSRTGGFFLNFDTKSKELTTRFKPRFFRLPFQDSEEEKIYRFVDTILNNVFNRTGISYQDTGLDGINADIEESGFGINLPENDPLNIKLIKDSTRCIKYYGGLYLSEQTKGLNTKEKQLLTKKRIFTEAHEKGHLISGFYGESDLTKKIQSAFNKLDISDLQSFEIDDICKKQRQQEEYMHYSPQEHFALFSQYLYNPGELIEYMREMKNYLDFHNDEDFDKEHLDYARKHLANDTGKGDDLVWRLFFRSINSKNEHLVLNLMNTLGL